MSHRDEILIRSATECDAPALSRLAALDSAMPLNGRRALVAEVDGTMLAALPLDGRPAIADPFSETAHLVELLRAHAAALDGKRAAPRRTARRLATATA